MIKLDKNMRFLSYIIYFIIILNLALSYNIPFVLPLAGLIALCIVPGFLLCLLFRIKVTDLYENFLYSIGLSIIFDLLFGLFLNTLLPIFRINNPLSSQNLQIGFSVIILILTSLIIYSGNAPSISFKIPKILKIEKIFLMFGFLIVVCIFTGIYLLNATITNIFLIFSIFLIPLLLFFLIVYHDNSIQSNSIKRIYPFIIYFISFSLLMVLALRSNFIIGVDTHEEYYFFYTTLIQSAWIPAPSFLLSSALSISILPAVFEKLLNIDPQLLFKVLYPLLFSITPLIIYVIVKKYVNELLALFASCFFMFQEIFVNTTENSRTSLAIFFFAFAVLVLCDKELSNVKKYAMLLLFIVGSIFSHYTSAFFFFLILFFAYLMSTVIGEFKHRKEIRFDNLPLIIFFITLIYFWEQQINNLLTIGLQDTNKRFYIFFDIIENDVSKHSVPTFTYTFFQKFFNFYPRLLCFVLIGIGIVFACYSWVQNERKNSFPKFNVKIDETLFFMGIVVFGLLVSIIFAPQLIFDTGRLSEFLFVVLPVFLIIGTCNLFNLIVRSENVFCTGLKFHKKIQPLIQYGKSHQIKIVSGVLLFLLIPQLLFATHITDQFYGGPYSVLLNSPKYSTNPYDNPDKFLYIFDQDAMALHWFNHNSHENTSIVSDYYGNKKITSLVSQQSMLYQPTLMESREEVSLKGYIFLPVISKNYNRFFPVLGNATPISSLNHIFNQKNKIYADGALLYK